MQPPKQVSSPQRFDLDVRKLNNDSGDSTENLQQRLQEQVAEFYGDEDAYGDEYQPEVVEEITAKKAEAKKEEARPASAAADDWGMA